VTCERRAVEQENDDVDRAPLNDGIRMMTMTQVCFYIYSIEEESC